MAILLMCATWILLSGQIVIDIIRRREVPFFWFGDITMLAQKDQSFYFFLVSSYWVATLLLSIFGIVMVSIQTYEGTRQFFPHSVSDILATLLVAVIFSAVCVFKYKRAAEAIKRNLYKRTILMLADDVSTEPECISLQDVIDLYDLDSINDIIAELKKMPPGNRSFRLAHDITADEDNSGPGLTTQSRGTSV